MKPYEKILIGGVGALMPVILNLLVVDFEALRGVPALRVCGYLIRVAVLFGLGGMVAYFQKQEQNRFKLFQLGIGAPALLLGMLNGSNIQHKTEAPSEVKPAAVQSWLGFEPAAQAEQAGVPALPAKSFESAKPSPADEILRGFLGKPESPRWFVISGSHLNAESARKQADQINTSRKGFHAEVYVPYGDSKYYAVVIGSDLDKSQASDVQLRAVKAGLPRDTYLWKLPNQ